jgi:hypothetical protein
MRRSDDLLIRVRGLVIPVSWDREGNPREASIHSPGEIEYLIERNQIGEELLKLARQEVEITGVLTKKVKDRRTISVTHYELLRNVY